MCDWSAMLLETWCFNSYCHDVHSTRIVRLSSRVRVRARVTGARVRATQARVRVRVTDTTAAVGVKAGISFTMLHLVLGVTDPECRRGRAMLLGLWLGLATRVRLGWGKIHFLRNE